MTNVKLGIIQNFMDKDTIDFGFKVGNLDLLHDPHVGGIYKRNYSGVEEPRPGYIINACMELLYCFDNAEIVKDLIYRNLQKVLVLRAIKGDTLV